MAEIRAKLVKDPTGIKRCWWCTATPQYITYHDEEWGRPVTDDARLFEKLVLEAFQSGLSWRTILAKREGFRRAFAGFDPARVARFGEDDVVRLLNDAAIVRHRGKIEAAIRNARVACKLIERHGSLASLVWRFEPPPASRPERLTPSVVASLTESPESRALATALKHAGWTFIGPTTAYAFMQALGLVNDHLEGCHVRAVVEAARTAFVRPTA